MTKDIGKEFMEKTKYPYLEKSLQQQGAPQPPLEDSYDPAASLIPLPEIETLPAYPLDLRKAIEMRTSLRKYAETPYSLEEFTFLLWTSQGVKEVTKRPVTLRNVPSAGARHAFETYVLVNNVAGLQPGLYRYIALEHALLPLNLEAEIGEMVTRGCLNQRMVLNGAATFIWVAIKERMYWRYGERGYRYLHLDAGHICQNLYLAAEAVQSGVCAIAAFDDDNLNEVLGLDGEERFVVYLASSGKR